MHNHHNSQWIEIVAKLTLARVILAGAISDVDDIASEIQAGRSNLSEQTGKMLDGVTKDLMSISDSIGDTTVDIPDILLELHRQRYQFPNQNQFGEYCSEVLNDSTLFNLAELADSVRKVS